MSPLSKSSGKVSQEFAQYTLLATPGRRCAECSMFRPPFDCTLVESSPYKIEAQGGCRFFERLDFTKAAAELYSQVDRPNEDDLARDPLGYDSSTSAGSFKFHWGNIGRTNSIAVFLVDGEFLRDKVDPDFTDYAEWHHEPYVPEGEIWVDADAAPGEVEVFANAGLREATQIASEATYDLTHDEVDSESLRDRQSLGDDLSVVEIVHLQDAGPFRVVVVDGLLIRDRYDPDFIYGGHCLVYPFIPPETIWLENSLSDTERPAILLHELAELVDMLGGTPYKPAHRNATAVEVEARRDPSRIDDLLEEQTRRAWAVVGEEPGITGTEDRNVSTSERRVLELLKATGLYEPIIAKLGLRKEQPTAGDVHQTTALGNEGGGRKRKPKPVAFLSDGHDHRLEKTDWSIPVQIRKTDEDKRVVFGWASVIEKDGKIVIDKQGDMILPEDLEAAVFDYVMTSREMDEMHTAQAKGRLVQSMVFTKEQRAVLGIPEDAMKNENGEVINTGWYAGWYIDDDDLWAAIKAGELKELSIGGSSLRTEV